NKVRMNKRVTPACRQATKESHCYSSSQKINPNLFRTNNKIRKTNNQIDMKKILLAALTIFFTASMHAQVQVNNELKTLINQSFSYFPKVKEAENGINTAEEKLNIAQTNLPTVDGTVSYNYVQPKIILPLQMNGETKDFQFAPVNNVNANVG